MPKSVRISNGSKEEGFAMTQIWLHQSVPQHFTGATDKYHHKPVRTANVQLKPELNTN
jgi:hypothetical protein